MFLDYRASDSRGKVARLRWTFDSGFPGEARSLIATRTCEQMSGRRAGGGLGGIVHHGAETESTSRNSVTLALMVLLLVRNQVNQAFCVGSILTVTEIDDAL